MSILRSKKKLLILAAVCLLAVTAIVLAVVLLAPAPSSYDDESYKTFRMGDTDTGFLRISAPRELELKMGSSGSGRTVIYGSFKVPKNVYIAVEQEEPAHLSTVEREGNLDVYAYELMHRMGLSEECELQEFENFLFFEYELMTAYDRYSDNPQTYMEYGLVTVYRADGQQGYVYFRCHADDKDTYREIFFDIVRSMEFL